MIKKSGIEFTKGNTNTVTLATLPGFSIMMTLDVAAVMVSC